MGDQEDLEFLNYLNSFTKKMSERNKIYVYALSLQLEVERVIPDFVVLAPSYLQSSFQLIWRSKMKQKLSKNQLKITCIAASDIKIYGDTCDNIINIKQNRKFIVFTISPLPVKFNSRVENNSANVLVYKRHLSTRILSTKTYYLWFSLVLHLNQQFILNSALSWCERYFSLKKSEICHFKL